MNYKSYFNKNNTIQYKQEINTARNPIVELTYGEQNGNKKISRYLFSIDLTKLKKLYNEGCLPQIGSLKHTIKMVNCGSFDMDLLNNDNSKGLFKRFFL